MNPLQEIEQDIILLRILLRIVSSEPKLQGRTKLLESLMDRLVLHDFSASAELKSFLNSPGTGQQIVDLLSSYAIEFVTEQVGELQRIRECREFTSTEEQLGREVLPNLLNEIKELL